MRDTVVLEATLINCALNWQAARKQINKSAIFLELWLTAFIFQYVLGWLLVNRFLLAAL